MAVTNSHRGRAPAAGGAGANPRMSRAPARRRAGIEDETPVFLSKTYSMIDTAPVAIAGWSVDGLSFEVRDLEQFTELLPMFFRHRNFRSFVRQLNFYGFRKMKEERNIDETANWSRFRHPLFQKGKSHLMSDIKRMNHVDPPTAASGPLTPLTKTTVSTMRTTANSMNRSLVNAKGKAEVPMSDCEKKLKAKVTQLTSTIEQLTSLVDTLLLERKTGQVDNSIPIDASTAREALTKKRKFAASPGSSASLPPSYFSSSPSMSAEVSSLEMGTFMATTLEQPDETQLFSRLSLDNGSAFDDHDHADGAAAAAAAVAAAACGASEEEEEEAAEPPPAADRSALEASLEALMDSGFFSKLAATTTTTANPGASWYTPPPAPPPRCFTHEPHLYEGQQLLRDPSLDGSITCVA